jgi:hypothetical protein
MDWIVAHWSILMLIVSEILPLIPNIQANSVGQLLIGIVKQLLSVQPPKT